ncbi:MAG: DnaD domain protein [Clostridia bacterium]|nr:DnaD domain protein [Clostridia bacterium]
MAGYIFNSNQIPMMLVPKSVADRFLNVASGAQIKVLLCLIRFEDMALTVEDISKHCNLDVSDVSDAIDFWIKNGMLVRRGASLSLGGVCSVQPNDLPRYNPESILERKNDDKEFSFLLDEVQRLLGKTVNHNDASVVFAMYDHLGLSSDLILLIINYCITNGKTNFRYIEKIALDWYDRGVDSFEKAETLIKALEKKSRAESAIAVYFGLEGRALSKKEKEYIENWVSAMGMSLEMIKEAYEICIDKKAKLSFSYINGILTDWFKKGYKTVADIDDSKPAVQAVEKSFDTDDIENEILQRLAGE